MRPQQLLAELPRGPDCLLQDLDLVNRRGLLVQLREADYRSASFLDQRVLRPDTVGAWFPLAQLLEQAGQIHPPSAPHGIFHVSHCGSTLVSRLLAGLPGCLPLREPLPLLALALARRELGRPMARLDTAGWDGLFDLYLRLAARSYRDGERALIKATSICANLVAPFLAHGEDSRALLLYTDLETWLATMLRGEAVRVNGRHYAPAWLTDFIALTGRDDLRLTAMVEAEQFALNWLTGMLHFQAALERMPARVQACDFEVFLAEPVAGIQGAASFLGLDATRAPELAAGPLMRSYAKDPTQPFDAAQRRRELQAAQAKVGGEIRAGLAYAERLVKELPALAPLARHFSRGASHAPG